MTAAAPLTIAELGLSASNIRVRLAEQQQGGVMRTIALVLVAGVVFTGCATAPVPANSPGMTPVTSAEALAATPAYTAENTTCASFYPPEMRRAQREGDTVLFVLIDEKGRVQEARVAKSSGFIPLDEAAAGCVLHQGRFKPATENGSPVRQWIRMKWSWRLTS